MTKTEKVLAFLPRTAIVVRVERMRWNLKTQERHLGHTDAPPDDCEGWARCGGTNDTYLHARWTAYYPENIHRQVEALLAAMEKEPNRWFRIAVQGYAAVPDPSLRNGYRATTSLYETWTLLGPYCKDAGVMPDLPKGEDGFYRLPFNMPENIEIEYDESLPDWDGTGDPVAKVARLDAVHIPSGEEIVVFDQWGCPIATTEVV